jgi:hypothetical protein
MSCTVCTTGTGPRLCKQCTCIHTRACVCTREKVVPVVNMSKCIFIKVTVKLLCLWCTRTRYSTGGVVCTVAHTHTTRCSTDSTFFHAT